MFSRFQMFMFTDIVSNSISGKKRFLSGGVCGSIITTMSRVSSLFVSCCKGWILCFKIRRVLSYFEYINCYVSIKTWFRKWNESIWYSSIDATRAFKCRTISGTFKIGEYKFVFEYTNCFQMWNVICLFQAFSIRIHQSYHHYHIWIALFVCCFYEHMPSLLLTFHIIILKT